MALGMKCGGTLQERAERLFMTKVANKYLFLTQRVKHFREIISK